ncbi:ribbon-helix-helix domain-containing protein [Rhizobium sp. S152]|uniref:CopG family ribbon-helix-helix protein n=1 Tax=Rhizobium sp. S152 TaxID=3055038 RepID=UPI0025A9C394|nr:ribbon-helix-helix domain-containing protein [Rhizobium sp. S152]MDM9627833.1 ribbon-helix-helix domain-containing protein [Rhizobium sp. S152]
MSNTSETVTLSIPAEVLADIEAIAEATDRSRSYIIVRALKAYLLNEGANIFASIRGHEQIAAGEYQDIDDVISDMDRIIAGKDA